MTNPQHVGHKTVAMGTLVV